MSDVISESSGISYSHADTVQRSHGQKRTQRVAETGGELKNNEQRKIEYHEPSG